MAHELLKFKSQLRAGAQIVGQELNRMDKQVRILDQESQKVHESFASTVAERLGETDDRQARHEAVTSQLHEKVQGTEAQSIHRDLLLDQEIVRLNKQHKWGLENHEISLNLMKQEMLEHQLAEQARDGEISELKAIVPTLMGRLREKARCQIRHQRLQGRVEENHHHHDTERQELEAEEGEETLMMMERDLEGNQMREGREDGTRDPHPSQKKMTMTPKTTNSLTCSHGSWPTPWDNKQESQRNHLPCFEMRNTKIYACG